MSFLRSPKAITGDSIYDLAASAFIIALVSLLALLVAGLYWKKAKLSGEFVFLGTAGKTFFKLNGVRLLPESPLLPNLQKRI